VRYVKVVAKSKILELHVALKILTQQLNYASLDQNLKNSIYSLSEA
jgi:hypothetical protein